MDTIDQNLIGILAKLNDATKRGDPVAIDFVVCALKDVAATIYARGKVEQSDLKLFNGMADTFGLLLHRLNVAESEIRELKRSKEERDKRMEEFFRTWSSGG